jgi:hypothetical protein
LHTFGCVVHVKKLGLGLHKLVDQSLQGILVGYEDGRKAYRVYDLIGQRMYVTLDLAFEELRAWSYDAVGKEDNTLLSLPL